MIALLVAAHLATDADLFDLLSESNVPTWFSQAQFLFAALACCAIAVQDPRTRTLWALLAFVMAFFSLDEVAKIHERVEDRAGDAFALLVIEPVLILALIAAIYAVTRGYLKGRPLVLLFSAGAALVLAEAAGAAADKVDSGSVGYDALAIIEEVGEMLTGTLVLVAALTVLVRGQSSKNA